MNAFFNTLPVAVVVEQELFPEWADKLREGYWLYAQRKISLETIIDTFKFVWKINNSQELMINYETD